MDQTLELHFRKKQLIQRQQFLPGKDREVTNRQNQGVERERAEIRPAGKVSNYARTISWLKNKLLCCQVSCTRQVLLSHCWKSANSFRSSFSERRSRRRWVDEEAGAVGWRKTRGGSTPPYSSGILPHRAWDGIIWSPRESFQILRAIDGACRWWKLLPSRKCTSL